MTSAEKSPGPITVRDARPDESQVIAEITRDAYREYKTLMDSEAWEGLRGAVEGALRPATEVEILAAESGGEIVGSVMLFPPEVETYGGAVASLPWPEVRLLSVIPSARRRGVARALMSACLERAARQGATRVGLHTSRSMRIAIDLYRRMGFVRAPEFDFHPPGGEVVEAYVLNLPPSEDHPAQS